MKIYHKRIKGDGRGGFWGDFGEIDMGWSYGEISQENIFPGEKIHYHKTGTTYFLGLAGVGLIEVEGERVELIKDMLLRIDPGEKYRVLTPRKIPFTWIVVCTSKDPKEKVVIE